MAAGEVCPPPGDWGSGVASAGVCVCTLVRVGACEGAGTLWELGTRKGLVSPLSRTGAHALHLVSLDTPSGQPGSPRRPLHISEEVGAAWPLDTAHGLWDPAPVGSQASYSPSEPSLLV